MTEHTPTPWRVEQDTDLIWGACDPDDNSTRGMGYSIVQGKSGSWGDRKPDMNEREANAALIVKAVNNHDALVKALTDLSNMYSHAWDRVDGGLTMFGPSVERFENAHHAAQIAICDATGKPRPVDFDDDAPDLVSRSESE